MTTQFATKVDNRNNNKIVTKVKNQIVSQLKKTDILTKLNNSNSDITLNIQKSFSYNNLTPQQPMRCPLGSLLRTCDVFWDFSDNLF